jgi:hypothetical protein
MVELARQNKIDPNKVVSIKADVFQLAYNFAGGGLYGVDKVIRTKEQADHSLPYLLAVALLDGDVMPAQFQPGRIARADVQQLLKKVSVPTEPGIHGGISRENARRDHGAATRRDRAIRRDQGCRAFDHGSDAYEVPRREGRSRFCLSGRSHQFVVVIDDDEMHSVKKLIRKSLAAIAVTREAIGAWQDPVGSRRSPGSSLFLSPRNHGRKMGAKRHS